MKINSIQKKLIFLLLPFFIITSGVLSGISYYLFNQSVTKSVNETAQLIGSNYANQIKASITSEIIKLEELSNMPSISRGADQAQIVETMGAAFNRFQKFDMMNFIFLDGMSVRYNGSTVALGDRDYFKKVVETKKPAISNPLISKATGKGSVTLAVPVMYNGHLTGVLTATYSLERLSDVVKEIKFKDTGYGFVTAKTGLVIAHPIIPEAIGKLDISQKKIDSDIKLKEAELDDSLLSLFKNTAEGNSQNSAKYTFNGISQVAVATPILLPGDQRWVMIIAAPETEVFGEINYLSRIMMAISLFFLIFAALFLTFLSKRFAKPIQLIRDECNLLTQGDLREQQTKISGEDEIGQLAKGFQNMRSNLRSLITQVQSKSEQVAASSEELTAGAQQSAEAANQVAAAITVIADGTQKQAMLDSQATATAKQNTAKTQQVSTAASEVSQIAKNTSQIAKEGSQSIEQAVESMKQIGQGSEAIQQSIAELAKGSQEISEIVSLISTIAGQTNLLALNAAIEAARAGEMGRGFAVVADEVRKLAEESNEAAQQIGELIKKNQENMDKAVAATQAGAEEIKTGINVVNSTGETFKQIAGLIFKLSEQTMEISESMEQIADGDKTMMESIYDIGQVSRENATKAQSVAAVTEEQSASMQQISASSQNLAKLAEDLQTAVAKFKI